MNLGSLAGKEFELSAAEGGIPVKNLTADSRKVEQGSVFFALAGSAANGADFISDAVSKGAVAIIAQRDLELGSLSVPLLRSDDPRVALAKMASRFHPRQPETMIAVTGTAGKTSVAAFVRQIWASSGFQAAAIGTTGVVAPGRTDYGNLTTPDPVTLHRLLDELAGDDITHAAIEASSPGRGHHRNHRPEPADRW